MSNISFSRLSLIALLVFLAKYYDTYFTLKGVYRLLLTETDGWSPSRLHLYNCTWGLVQSEAAKAADRKNGRIHTDPQQHLH